MILKKWENIPNYLQCSEVKEYYEILKKKKSA